MGVAGAMRARDVGREEDRHRAEAERALVIRRRPPTAPPPHGPVVPVDPTHHPSPVDLDPTHPPVHPAAPSTPAPTLPAVAGPTPARRGRRRAVRPAGDVPPAGAVEAPVASADRQGSGGSSPDSS